MCGTMRFLAMEWFLLTWLGLVVSLAAGEVGQPAAEPQDITNINSLEVKQPRIDPKLRKALLRVLNKIKEEENGQLPPDLPEEEFARVIGDPAETEDLGSYEIDEGSPEVAYEEALRFGQRIVEGKVEEVSSRQEDSGAQQEQQSGGFGGYFINVPTGGEPTAADIPQNPDQPQPEAPQVPETPQTPEAPNNPEVPQNPDEGYNYDKPSEGFGSSEQTETKSEGYSYPSASSPSEATPESSSISEVINESPKEPTTQPSDTEKLPEREQEIVENADKIENDAELLTESSNKNEVEGRLGRNAAFEQEGSQESLISVESFTKEQTKDIPRFLPTNPTPDNENEPSKLEPTVSSQIVVQQSESEPEVKTTSEKEKDEKEKEESEKEKNKNVKHVVDFAQSPLITAFTVQQDDKGVPHKIIPLNYVNPTQPPPTTEDPDVVAQRQRELEEKEFILQQQLRSLQEEKYKYTGGPRPDPQELLRLQQQQAFQRQQQHPVPQLQQSVALQQPQLQQPFQQQPQVQTPFPLLLHQAQITPSIEHPFPQSVLNQVQQPFPQQNQLFPQKPFPTQQPFQQQQNPGQQQFQFNQNIPQQQFNQQQFNQPTQQPFRQQFQQPTQPPFQQRFQQPFQQFQQPTQQPFQQPTQQPFQQPTQQPFQQPTQQPFQQQNQQFLQRQPFIQKSRALEPEEFLRQQERLRYQQNLQRQQELQRHQQLQNQQDLYRQQQEQLKRQQFENQRFNQRPFLQNQNLELQKSVDFNLPLFDHNRVHRHEPNNYVRNPGFNRPPATISGQIQSLISQSGINTGLPQNTQTDLNLVSKILALDYESPQYHFAKNNIKRQSPTRRPFIN